MRQPILAALALGTAFAAPALAAAPPAPVDVVLPHEELALDSAVLGETRHINIYTPPGYAEHPTATYPTVYLLDGGLAEDFPHVTDDIDAAIRAGEMRPVVVIGIENTERRRDLTGPTEVAADRAIAPRVGGSAAFRRFLRDELAPAIDRRVRGNGARAIVGESLAGLFVVETLLEEPRLFDTYVAFSPSLWWNGRALARDAADLLRQHPETKATVYVATASDDGIEEASAALAAALRTAGPAGLIWWIEPHAEVKHATIFRALSPGAFRKMFSPVGSPMQAEAPARSKP